MKQFILGAFTGMVAVAIAFTFIPDKAHKLIDQAGEVRILIEDVASRLDKLEHSDVHESEFVLPEAVTTSAGSASTTTLLPVDVPAALPDMAAAAAFDAPAPVVEPPPGLARQSVDFDNLATGLSRVTGALERLNRTMRPRERTSPRTPSSNSPASPGSTS